MREFIEFRVAEEFAHLVFGEAEGRRLSDSVRKVTLSRNDPKYQRVGEVQRRLRLERDEAFFYSWLIRRRYTVAELERAEFFAVEWTSTFEPAGEECGTIYDDAIACQHIYVPPTTTRIPGAGTVTVGPYTCGVGARQLTPLILDARRLPRGKDFARTIASEDIVSERARSVLEGIGVADITFEPVHYRGVRPKPEQWYRMVARSEPVEIVAPTVAGVGPFDLDDSGTYRCPQGHAIGLNLVSELWIDRPSDGSDVLWTRQSVGARVGLLRPRKVLVVSRRVRRAVKEFGLKGWRFEVAHTLATGRR